MQAATGKARLPEPENEAREALVARGPVMFMTPDDERQGASRGVADSLGTCHADKNGVGISEA